MPVTFSWCLWTTALLTRTMVALVRDAMWCPNRGVSPWSFTHPRQSGERDVGGIAAAEIPRDRDAVPGTACAQARTCAHDRAMSAKNCGPGAMRTAVALQSLRSALSFCNSPQMTGPRSYIQFTPELITGDGEATGTSTEQFLRDYMEAFSAFVTRVLTALPRVDCRE
jgi:hypothetical protein